MIIVNNQCNQQMLIAKIHSLELLYIPILLITNKYSILVTIFKHLISSIEDG